MSELDVAILDTDFCSSTATATIDKRAVIDPSAKIGKNVSIGPYAVIGPNVEIGEGTHIASHAIIHCNTKIGKRNLIHSHASVGGDPQDIEFCGEATYLEIGDDNKIREFCTINRGSSKEGLTRLGNKIHMLAYSHVAHDCQIGNNVLFVNNATLAGHVIIDDYVILGALTTVHQFCRVGAYTFLSRSTQISKDLPPYMLVRGVPGYPCGLNLVGLHRHGFSKHAIRNIKKAFRILFRSGMKLVDARIALEELSMDCAEVRSILDFMDKSKRGIPRRCHD